MTGPPLAKRGTPHWPPYRPSDAPPGPMATASLTGHLLAIRGGPPLATYWPQRDGRGRLRPALPRLAKGTGGGAYGHTGAPAPHFPATYGQRGAAPLTGLPLATHWPQRGGAGAPSPGPPPTDHLRTHSPHRPIEAFGREASPLPD